MGSNGFPGTSRIASAYDGPWRARTRAIVGAALAAALVVLVLSAVETSSARVAATTTSDGLLSAGTVVLSRPGDSTEVFFNADQMYPGMEIRGCVVAVYDESVSSLLRLSGRHNGGTGLDEYIDLQLSVLPGDTCPDDESGRSNAPSQDAGSARELYSGRLDNFWRTHSNFATGLDVAPSVEQGDRMVIEAVIEVVDDNRAAGLSTGLSIIFEGRPA